MSHCARWIIDEGGCDDPGSILDASMQAHTSVRHIDRVVCLDDAGHTMRPASGYLGLLGSRATGI